MLYKLVVVVEAKFRSPNRSDSTKWYELLQNWVLGMELKDTLGCEEFVLVNLLRKRHENEHREDPRRDFAERACVLSPNSRFVVAYWEDLIAAAPSICDYPNSGLLVSWGKNKSELLGKPAFDF
jgi:hypothetical protein